MNYEGYKWINDNTDSEINYHIAGKLHGGREDKVLFVRGCQ